MPGGRGPFLGRIRQLSLLLDRLREAAAGLAGCVVVSGEPGIGKTALLSAFAEAAEREGAAVIRGAAFVAEAMPPYLPFLEALGRYIQGAAADSLRSQVAGKGPTLASIFPELVERLGPQAAGYPLPPDQGRLRLFEAVADFLGEIANPRPLVLLLDDLHWADSASLDLLCHILRYRPEARLLIVGAMRYGEASESAALEMALAELTRLRRLTRIELDPLGRTEIEGLFEFHLGGPGEPHTLATLHAQSEGNPFFAEELLKGWLEGGQLTRTSPSEPWGLPSAAPATLPASITGAVQMRLARLPGNVIDPLRVAAIVGRIFPTSLLAGLLDLPEEVAEDQLRPAVDAALLRSHAPGEFAFSHEKIREVLYNEVSASRRQRLHDRIGLALEASQRSPGAQRLSDLAFHFARSTDHLRGARYSLEAGRAAMRAYAGEEARLHFRTAASLLPGDDERRGGVLVELGEACLLSGDEPEAVRRFREALKALDPDDAPQRARAAHGLGRALWRQDDLEAARRALEDGLRVLGDSTSTAEAIILRVDLATLLGVILGRMEDSLAHAERALAQASALRDPGREAPATRILGFLQVLDNRLTEGLGLLEHGLHLAEGADDPAEAAEVCSALAQAYAWQGRFNESRGISWRREAFALLCHQPYQLRYVYSWLAYLDAVQGSWKAAELKLAQSRAAVEPMVSHRPAAFLDQVRGFLAFQQGDYAAATVSMTEALTTFRSSDPQELILCMGTLALSLQAAGKRDKAQACREELVALLARITPGKLAVGSAHGCLALLAIGEADRVAAAEYYGLLLPFRGQHHWFLVDRILGELSLLVGDASSARQHLAEAEALATRELLRPELGRVLLDQADLAMLEPSPASIEESRGVLGRARTTFLDLGIAAGIAQVDERLGDLGVEASDRAKKTYAAGLSGREVAVLRLVAAGLSNREIARQLSLSENTVAKHLTSIFNKAGLDNRAAAAAFAIRNGLA